MLMHARIRLCCYLSDYDLCDTTTCCTLQTLLAKHPVLATLSSSPCFQAGPSVVSSTRPTRSLQAAQHQLRVLQDGP